MSIVLVVAPQVGQARDPQVSSIIASPSPFPIPVRFPLPVWRTGVDECERHGNPVPRKDPNENVHHRQREQHQRVRHPRGGRRRHGNPVRFLRQPAGVGGSGRPLARREAPGRVEQPAGRDGGQEVQGPEHGHQPDLGAHPGTRRAGGPEGRRTRRHARAEGGPTRQAEGGTEGQRRRTGGHPWRTGRQGRARQGQGGQEDDRPQQRAQGQKGRQGEGCCRAARGQQDRPGGRHAATEGRSHAGRGYEKDGLAKTHRPRLHGRRDEEGRVPSRVLQTPRAANGRTGSTSSIERLPLGPPGFGLVGFSCFWKWTGSKGGAIYLHILRWPAETDALPAILHRLVRHSMLTGGSAAVKQSEIRDRGACVGGPAARSGHNGRLQLDGPARLLSPLFGRADGLKPSGSARPRDYRPLAAFLHGGGSFRSRPAIACSRSPALVSLIVSPLSKEPFSIRGFGALRRAAPGRPKRRAPFRRIHMSGTRCPVRRTKGDTFLEGVAMTEDQRNEQKNDARLGDIARRDFVALSVSAGLAATAASAAAALDIVETDVEIKTLDGTCDAAFIPPKTGSHPGVLIWPDAFGLRPAMRDIAKRLAPGGYAGVVAKPFYCARRGPG